MIQLIKVGGRYNAQIEEYEVNEYDEIASIPEECPTGSTATVIETGKTYKKLPDGTWTEWSRGGSGGGGGDAVPVYIPFTITTEPQLEISTTADFSSVKADYLAKKTLAAEGTIDNTVIVYFQMMSAFPKDNPTTLGFGGVFDFSGTGEEYDPTFAQIGFSANGVQLKMIGLTPNV